MSRKVKEGVAVTETAVEESQSKDKKVSLHSLISKLQKDFPSTIRDVKVSGQVKRLVLSSPQLNYIMGGGYPIGRIIQLYGPESSGKSTLTTYIASEIQKQPTKNIVVYMDFERSFEESHALEIGLDTSPEKFIFLRPENGEEGFTVLEELVKSNQVGLVIVDSDATVPTRNQIADDYGKAGFGPQSKLFADALRKFNPILEKYETSMIWISQERDNIGVMYGPDTKPTGGSAIKFYASQRYRVTRIDYIKEAGEIVGIFMKVRNIKNKAGIPFREAEMKLYYKGGFDTESEYLDYIVKFEFVKQKGAYYQSEEYGFSLQGKERLLSYLNEHLDIYKTLKDRVNAYMLKRNEQDIENLAKVSKKVDIEGELIEDPESIPEILEG